MRRYDVIERRQCLNIGWTKNVGGGDRGLVLSFTPQSCCRTLTFLGASRHDHLTGPCLAGGSRPRDCSCNKSVNRLRRKL